MNTLSRVARLGTLTGIRSGGPINPLWQEVFLRELRQHGSVRHACEAAGVARNYAQVARQQDEQFAELWDHALADFADTLEHEAHRRAVVGVEVPIYYRGEQIGTVRQYSDSLLAQMLKAHRPERYGNKVTVSHANGATINEAIERELSRLAELEHRAAISALGGDSVETKALGESSMPVQRMAEGS
jgi:hypothetical protein